MMSKDNMAEGVGMDTPEIGALLGLDDPATLLLELSGKALIVTVDRPDKLNALNRQVLDDLASVVEAVGRTPRTRIAGLILVGAGDRAFVAGADIAQMAAMSPEEATEFAAAGQRVPDLLEALDRPSIAAVNGYALGGGCEMAMGCDFIYATENAVFGQPEVSLGLIPCFGGCTRLQARVGLGRARELVATGRKFSAEQAVAWGLVNEMYADRAALLAAAVATIEEIARQAPAAVSAARGAVRAAYERGHLAGLEEERGAFGALFRTEDMREGTQAFLGKRPPTFADR